MKEYKSDIEKKEVCKRKSMNERENKKDNKRISLNVLLYIDGFPY